MMTSHGKLRMQRGSLYEYDSQVKDLRVQLCDQMKVLDGQVEVKGQQLSDLSEFFRRRGDIEAEYARALDKLTERFTLKAKRKELSGQSVSQCWSVLLTQTRAESREHAALSDSCTHTLTQRLTHCSEDTHRLAKRSKEVGVQMQDELLKVTTELQTALKTYHQYHTDSLTAEGKLKEATRLEERQTGKSADLGITQSGSQRRSAVKKMEKIMEKRHGRVQETQLKCTKARNDYLLNLAAANATMNKYYLQNLSTLIDCTDLGFHLSLERVIRSYLASRGRVLKSEEAGLKQLEQEMTSLDQGGDRDALLQNHDTAFCLPFRFSYHPHEGDQVNEVSAESQVRYEIETRFQQLQSRLSTETLETEEVTKTLKATLAALLDSMCDSDSNPTPDLPISLSHDSMGAASASKLALAKRRANQQETETFYFMKVKEYLTGSSLISKLQAKHDLLQEAIQKAEAVDSDPSRRRRRMSRTQSSGQQIPVVVESCIRFINLHGLHHEGIFRVPGSQREVNHLRDAFERGEDPLTDSDCDIDSVAGVLKLYFRGLDPPLFPDEYYTDLLDCVQNEGLAEKAAQIKSIVSSFPRLLLIVIRYLFAFLNHVSQYSDENMMQPYNLAVCFGPSLLRGSDSGDVVARQPQVNDLVKTMIIQYDAIFPSQSELPGPVYEKHMTLEQEYCEPITEEGDGETEQLHSEDEWEVVAMFDYTARSATELSFKQGESLLLHSKASSEWWRGELGGVRGLIPHKYISVLEGAERGRTEEGSGGSTGNLDSEELLTENTTRLRVNSDSASLPGRQRAVEGSESPVQKVPLSPMTCQNTGNQERRHTFDSVRQRAGERQTDGGYIDRPDISKQMNSVFKELLSRQPPLQPATHAPPSSLPSSSSSSSLSSSLPGGRKVGFSFRGRALFRPADQ
ncbi:rho GTPase-activating protein 4 isoform X2 [Salmo salar]|uniref:Rho GTPase-activating protein 4 isoform X2 n=1 Tax=Salmo salar TaxID=8030 RepID=A0ABM3CWN7_SALSA|nr:rho GTPase-activating protein 4-like isoform X2 [Salmo salar]|eukprot:XP_013998526.1 PREDICTED: rho GTPase-activating protein 4-like isoform X3 [Salmo salar]